ncbi:Nn.00g117630.m01.CDS01 [Neocucurbitaria sp. VM-36]
MALDSLRRGMAEYGVDRILDSLPSHESLEWIPLSAASPPTALVLGSFEEFDILAFLVKLGDKPREVRYCLRPNDSVASSYSIRTILQDEVVQLSLKAPFKYNAEVSKGGKRKFSMVIKWYFMARGLIQNAFTGDDTDNWKRFADALRRIDARQRAERGGIQEDQPDNARETPTKLEDSLEVEEPGSAYRLRSRDKMNSEPQQVGNDQPTTPDNMSAVAGASEDDNPDLTKLREHLDSYGLLYLLMNIPEADEVQFVTQNRLPEAQPKKLFIGHHAKTGDEIYAYMRPTKGHHEMNFYVENSLACTGLSTEEVTKQRILHPFNKTYPKSSAIDQADRARLTLIVKWYFIAAGIAKNIVLKETKAYPDRLRAALEYIAQRMGSAAVEPPESVTTSDGADADVDLQRVNNTRSRPGASSPPAPAASSPSAHHKQPSPQSSTQEPPRGTKRSAEDAEFEDLARIISQDQDLTQKINDVDQEIEIKDIQRQNFLDKLDEERQNFLEKLEVQRQIFMEKWEKQNNDIMEKREKLDASRMDVRQRFKKQSLAVAQGRSQGSAKKRRQEL